MIDQAKKGALIEHIKQREISRTTEIMLAPDLYFDGYEDEHCTVCANISPSISTSRFVARLREVQRRPDVSAVVVRFYSYEDALEYADSWISSDSVYVITGASVDSVRDWFADFEVSDVWLETDFVAFVDLPEIPDGFHLVAVWWD